MGQSLYVNLLWYSVFHLCVIYVLLDFNQWQHVRVCTWVCSGIHSLSVFVILHCLLSISDSMSEFVYEFTLAFTCLPVWLCFFFHSTKSQKSIGHSRNTDSFLKFGISTPTNTAIPVFPENSWSFLYRNLPQPLLDPLCMHDKQKYSDLFSVLCMCAKDTKQKFLRSFPKRASYLQSCKQNRASESGHRLQNRFVWEGKHCGVLIVHPPNHLQ